MVNRTLLVLLLVLSLGLCMAFSPGLVRVFTNHKFAYKFEYNVEHVLLAQENNVSVPPVGVTLVLDHSEKIVVFGSAESRVAAPEGQGNRLMSVFYDEVKNCLRVPVDGLFEAYYVCAFNELNEDFKSSYGGNFAMRAAFEEPNSAYICYVNYS